MTDAIQVFTTVDTPELAKRIAGELVERRLAACVQVVGPIASTYRWEGQIETAEEWLCLIKSSVGQFSELERVLRDLHPYDVPEILAVPVVAGGEAYLEWLHAELRSRDS